MTIPQVAHSLARHIYEWARRGVRVGVLMSAVVGGTSVAIAAQTSIDNAGPLTIESIAEIARSTRGSLRTIDITFTLRQRPVDPAAGKGKEGLVEWQTERWLAELDPVAFYWRKVRPSGNDKLPVATVETSSVNDSEVIFYQESKQAYVSPPGVPRQDFRRELEFLTYLLLFAPEANGPGVDDGSLESLLKHGTLRAEREQIGKSECVIVDATTRSADGDPVRYATAWLDLQRGAIPVQYQIYARDKSVRVVSRANELTEFRDDSGAAFWLPKSIEIDTTVHGVKYRREFTLDVEKTRINPPISSADLAIVFPPGIQVFDTVEGRRYSTGPVPRQPTSAAAAGRGWLLWINIVVISLLAVGFFLRRHRIQSRVTG